VVIPTPAACRRLCGKASLSGASHRESRLCRTGKPRAFRRTAYWL